MMRDWTENLVRWRGKGDQEARILSPKKRTILANSLPVSPDPYRLKVHRPAAGSAISSHREERVLGHRHASFWRWTEVEASEAANHLAKYSCPLPIFESTRTENNTYIAITEYYVRSAKFTPSAGGIFGPLARNSMAVEGGIRVGNTPEPSSNSKSVYVLPEHIRRTVVRLTEVGLDPHIFALF
ncbi:uncharacterized protein MCYG_00182 [Microsporum canis CBS 113480]|uniref:Uncharacterized protein n=1 Tax=Arthroderma otae (strain ATCC MYA-4605 / CBS 113480) TaxID=554155 RepID=C5FBW0_ARTOC|nr:uncharacterized protein MCYG_00182 [Microsporum canis CBS 113480]EEQ27294.1 predicted protein [Microsporum canis CBS 113480]